MCAPSLSPLRAPVTRDSTTTAEGMKPHSRFQGSEQFFKWAYVRQLEEKTVEEMKLKLSNSFWMMVKFYVQFTLSTLNITLMNKTNIKSKLISLTYACNGESMTRGFWLHGRKHGITVYHPASCLLMGVAWLQNPIPVSPNIMQSVFRDRRK